MTIPYNSSVRSMLRYLADSLVKLDCNKDNTSLYSSSPSDNNKINTEDLCLLIECLRFIINNDFEKLKKLSKYLRNIAIFLNML